MRRFLVFLLTAAIVFLAAPGASAHGGRNVNDIEWTVGWAVEPAFAGQPNAVQLMLDRNGSPVEGAQDDLTVAVILGRESTEAMPLRTVFSSPGEYRADLIPTRPGDYTLRFVGTIEGESVDESWTASQDGFHEVADAASISFPDQAPTNAQLAERLVVAEQSADDASGASTLPLIISIVALAAGLAGVGLALRRPGA